MPLIPYDRAYHRLALRDGDNQPVDTSVPAATTKATWSSANLPVAPAGAEELTVLAAVQGADAGSAGDVTFVFEAQFGTGAAYYVIPEPVVVALAGVALVSKFVRIVSRGYTDVRLKSVHNADTTYAATVNAALRYTN